MPKRTFGIGKGIGAGAAALTSEQPWYYSHPGELHPDSYLTANGIVKDPETGLWPEEAYKIAPGIVPITYEEYYRAHSRPYEAIPGPRLAELDLMDLERRIKARTARETSEPISPILAERNTVLHRLSTNPRGITEPILSRNRAPIDDTYISPWQRYIKKGVFEPLETSAREHLMEKVLPAIDAQLISTGNFKSPRRQSLYGTAIRDMERNLNASKERALYESAQMGAKSFEAERSRNIEEAGIAQGDIRGAIDAARTAEHVIGEQQKREMLDEASIEALERTKTAQGQLAIDMARAENERMKEYERDMAARKLAAIKNIPIPSTTSAVYPSTAPTASPSLLSTLAGVGTSLYGMNLSGRGASGGAGRKAGGRVTKANGGSILDRYSQRIDPLNDMKDQLMNDYIQGNQSDNFNPIPEFLVNKEEDIDISPNISNDNVPVSPIEQGASLATQSHARMKRDYHRSEMEKYADRLNKQEPINPWGSFLARAGAKFAASGSPFNQRIGEALESGIGGYEGAIKENISSEDRNQKLREALDETYRIEELDKHKRDLEEKEFSLEKMKAEEVARHNKELEKYYGRPVSPKKGKKEEPVTVAVPVPDDEGEVKTENIKIEPLTKKREERLEKLKDAWTANEEALNISKSMLEDVNEGVLGYTGPGGSHLNATAATLGGLYGNTGKHENFFKKSAALATAKAASLRGIRPNIFIEKQISRTKPEESNTPETIKQNVIDHVDLFTRNNIEIVAERKMLKSGVPDDIMDDAIIAWRKDNKPGEGELKGSPLDYLPNAWKITIGEVQKAKNAEKAPLNEVEKEEMDDVSKLSAIQKRKREIEEKLGIING